MKEAMLLIPLALLFSSVGADTLHLKGGRKVVGKVIEQNEDTIRIQLSDADPVPMDIARTEVIGIVPGAAPWEEQTPLRAEYANRREAVQAADDREHLTLADWCWEQGLYHEAANELVEFLQAVPMDRVATDLLRKVGSVTPITFHIERLAEAYRLKTEDAETLFSIATWAKEAGAEKSTVVQLLVKVLHIDPRHAEAEAVLRSLRMRPVDGLWVREADYFRNTLGLKLADDGLWLSREEFSLKDNKRKLEKQLDGARNALQVVKGALADARELREEAQAKRPQLEADARAQALLVEQAERAEAAARHQVEAARLEVTSKRRRVEIASNFLSQVKNQHAKEAPGEPCYCNLAYAQRDYEIASEELRVVTEKASIFDRQLSDASTESRRARTVEDQIRNQLKSLPTAGEIESEIAELESDRERAARELATLDSQVAAAVADWEKAGKTAKERLDSFRKR